MSPKQSLRAKDFRYHRVALSFLPMLGIAAALAASLLWWNSWVHMAAGAITLANLALIKGVHGWFYRVAERSLGKPAGARGVDYLLITMEPPATAHITKIVPDDEGLLFMEDGYVCLNTLGQFYRVRPENFLFEPMQLNKRFPGMLFRFVPEGGSNEVKLAVTFIYYGSNLKVAADLEAVRLWAAHALAGIVDPAISHSGRQPARDMAGAL
jgi:hypothetical protein